MLETLFLVAVLAGPAAEAESPASDCPPRLAALLERSETALTSRQVAARLFGDASFEAVEVTPAPRSERHLEVRFRLFFDDARVVFVQPAAGGAERLTELDLFVALPELPLPVALGGSEEELTARLGEPSRVELPAAAERRLVYACESTTGESSVAFRFTGGALSAVEWRLAPE